MPNFRGDTGWGGFVFLPSFCFKNPTAPLPSLSYQSIHAVAAWLAFQMPWWAYGLIAVLALFTLVCFFAFEIIKQVWEVLRGVAKNIGALFAFDRQTPLSIGGCGMAAMGIGLRVEVALAVCHPLRFRGHDPRRACYWRLLALC